MVGEKTKVIQQETIHIEVQKVRSPQKGGQGIEVKNISIRYPELTPEINFFFLGAI